jgi:Family of unknown function (DUF6263)
MNVWRWLGLFFFLGAVTCFVGAQLPVYAGGDKDKKKEEPKKEEPKKEEPKKGEPVKGSGEELKFKAFDEKASPFFQEVDTYTTQVMKVMGQDVKQVQKQTFYIEWTPKPKDKQGNYVVEQKVVGVKMNIDIGGNTITFDSFAEKQPQNPMTDFFKALMKQKLTFIIMPDLKVDKIEGREEFIKSLSETNPAIKTLLDTIMSKDALTKMAEPTWWAVPSKAVSKGDTWTKTSELNLGPIGKYDTKFTFTYEGPVQTKQDKIKIDADLKYTQPSKDSTGLPFTIKSAKLESKNGTGEAFFDRAAGRIDSSKLTMKLEGTLTIEVGNMATEISLNQDQTSTTRTANKLEDLTKK